ncbi:MAG: hypothetical protein IJ186_04035 [Bacilli bacterium]|nr:hypothetical protein [Bacilli bacterium]
MEEVIGLVIEGNEKQKLKEICIKYNIPLSFEELFEDANEYHLWAFNRFGIGLAGVQIMMNLKLIIHGLSDFENYIKNHLND